MAKRKNITKKAVQSTERKPYAPQVDAKPEIDEGPFDDIGLSVRMRKFVAALVGPAGGVASRAAQMAGYSDSNRNVLDVTASTLLRNPKIQEAISHALAAQRATPEWARSVLIELASSSMANFISVDVNGEATIDFTKAAAAGALGQIKEYREEGIKAGDGEASIIKRTIKVHDRNAAIRTLLQLHGLLNDVAGQSGTGDVPLEKHPAAGRVKAPFGTTAVDDQPGTVQDRPGGPAIGKDGMGQAKVD